MMNQHDDVRFSLPSKGRLAQDAADFLTACGLEIRKPNPRQYAASIPTLPNVTVLFQRPGDIVVSVRDGSVDFGITGMDVVVEQKGENGAILVLHDELGFGHCYLALAVPEAWSTVHTMQDLADYGYEMERPLRVATKFPCATGRFLTQHDIPHRLIHAEGTLEVAPAIGYADVITDLVSSGQTLRDNRLRPLEDGTIIQSQAVLIANRCALKERPEVLSVAHTILELAEAHLRAEARLSVFANIRGESPEAIAERIFAQETIGGLQGPTVSRMIVRDGNLNWYAVHIIVRRDQISQAMAELRSIGGSGVVVTPVTYIFEEEPERCRAMMEALNGKS
jgi:ATP phosphoribosyltransferase